MVCLGLAALVAGPAFRHPSLSGGLASPAPTGWAVAAQAHRKDQPLRSLRAGVRRFLAGDYIRAETYINQHLWSSNEKTAMAKFMLGVVLVSRSFVEKDRAEEFRKQGLVALRDAKFRLRYEPAEAFRELISPKIVRLYDELGPARPGNPTAR